MSARYRQTRALGTIFELLLLAIVSYGLTHASRGTELLRPSANAPDSYTVAGITYTLDPAHPTRIAKVRFALDPNPDAASTIVRAKLVSAGTTYVTCARTAAGAWECPFSQVTVAAIDRLTVDISRSAAPRQLCIYLPVVRR